ncbi:MAG: hypothetical protein R3F34_08710 [Planctomycetota bacterium]
MRCDPCTGRRHGRGDVDARDVVDAYRAYPPEFADERVREYALELVRGAWSEIDRAEFDALAEAVPGLAESFVDEALWGGGAPTRSAFLRGDTEVADVLLSRIVEATRSVERDRLLGAIGAVGAGDALRWVEARCRARDEAAYDALVSLPGEAALLAWLDAQEDASPQRRAALWQHVLDVRSDELLAVVDRIDASTPEFETIVEGAMLVGDERAAAVLLACAARPDVRAAERANWVEAASEFGRYRRRRRARDRRRPRPVGRAPAGRVSLRGVDLGRARTRRHVVRGALLGRASPGRVGTRGLGAPRGAEPVARAPLEDRRHALARVTAALPISFSNLGTHPFP